MDRTQLASRIESTVGFRPRPGQVEAVYKLVVDQQDLILIAPTGWGKSVVFQAVPALRGGICIMIMPLTLLEEDQVSLPILDRYWDSLPDMFYAGQINI